MDKNNINVSKVESFMDSLLRTKVSNQIFPSDIPSSIDKTWNDFVVVDCSNIRDNDAIGNGFILVYLYARPFTDGTKNVPKMDAMEKALNTAIASTGAGTYRLSRDTTWPEYDNRCKWHTNVVKLNIIIV